MMFGDIKDLLKMFHELLKEMKHINKQLKELIELMHVQNGHLDEIKKVKK